MSAQHLEKRAAAVQWKFLKYIRTYLHTQNQILLHKHQALLPRIYDHGYRVIRSSVQISPPRDVFTRITPSFIREIDFLFII